MKLATLTHALNGLHGMPGLNAQRPVEMEHKQETEFVRIAMVQWYLGHNAHCQPLLRKMKHATHISVQVSKLPIFTYNYVLFFCNFYQKFT